MDNLEPVGDKLAETRIIGNYIQNNTYGIHMDFGRGYFNDMIRISNNEISYNKIGIYVNLTHGAIYENNFIENEKHAVVGPGGCWGLRDSGLFYLNVSKTMYGFLDDPVGNYWDDWDNETIPYEIFPGYYDYFPLPQPVEVPQIDDDEGPFVEIENETIIPYNETHIQIKFDFFAEDQNYLGTGNSKFTLPYFGVVTYLGPNMRRLDPPYNELEFPWNGHSGEILGLEMLTKTFEGSLTTSILNATWLQDATVTFYFTDMYGNWNKNDSIAPYVKIVLENLTIKQKGEPVTVYVLVSDWSSITKVQLRYTSDSGWIAINMTYDASMHLYYVAIPIQRETSNYRIYAEDIYGNGFLSEEHYIDVVEPKIISVTQEPLEPTNDDPVKIFANITDPSGIDSVTLSYSTDQTTWFNITMNLNLTSELYEAIIPAMPEETTVYYKIYANDTFGNLAESQLYNYTVLLSKQPRGENLVLYVAGASLSIGAIRIIVYIIKKVKKKTLA